MKSLIRLTPELAGAAGHDAGNRSMRMAGRTSWNEDDYNEACKVKRELMLKIYGLTEDEVED